MQVGTSPSPAGTIPTTDGAAALDGMVETLRQSCAWDGAGTPSSLRQSRING